MSKTYIVSRNGETVTKAPINDNKIPIYANETALDADLANIPDNTLVATRGGHDDVIDQMKAYIRDQNELSDWEDITIGTSSATATEMRFDGFLAVNWQATSALKIIFCNDVQITKDGTGNSSSITFPFKKGDKLYTNGPVINQKVCHYKKRDYSNRQ